MCGIVKTRGALEGLMGYSEKYHVFQRSQMQVRILLKRKMSWIKCNLPLEANQTDEEANAKTWCDIAIDPSNLPFKQNIGILIKIPEIDAIS